MADSLPPVMRSEQATRPLLYDLWGVGVERGSGSVGGARVGDGDGVAGASAVAVGVAVGIGLSVGSLPPQANIVKLRPAAVRNTIDAGLLIRPQEEPIDSAMVGGVPPYPAGRKILIFASEAMRFLMNLADN